MKAIEQYFTVVLSDYSAPQGGSIFESVDEILKCDHSNESYRAVLPVVLFIMLYWQVGSNF